MKNLRNLAGGDTMRFLGLKDFREELLATIRNWDFLLINDGEARMLSGEDNLKKAAAKILAMGPHTLVIKRGEYGAMIFREDYYFIVPGYIARKLSLTRPARETVSQVGSSGTWRSKGSI